MQVTISLEELRKEMERILKARFGVQNIGWNDDGSAVVDTELDKLLRETEQDKVSPFMFKSYTDLASRSELDRTVLATNNATKSLCSILGINKNKKEL